MLSCSNVVVSHNKHNLFSPISFVVKPGTCTVIMGRSGIGKSSLLNAICGTVKFSGNIKTDKTFTVFQDNNQLFPWYTVRKNLELVCTKPFENLVALWGLESLLDKKPLNLSGGQRQRFTLIRAICSGSPVLLCDEPCSALDSYTGNNVINDFKKIIVEQQLCCLWITHNPIEAITLGDQVYHLTVAGLKNITGEKDVTKFFTE